MYIKKFDERSHKKCRYYCPYTRYRRYLRYTAACCQEQDHSRDDAYKIGDDPDILELSLFPCIAYDECDRIICGYAKISRHIESGSEAYDHHSDHQTYHPYGDRRIVGRPREVDRDRVVQLQKAVLFEYHYGARGELLAYGRKVKHGIYIQFPALKVSLTGRPRGNDLTVLRKEPCPVEEALLMINE